MAQLAAAEARLAEAELNAKLLEEQVEAMEKECAERMAGHEREEARREKEGESERAQWDDKNQN